MYLGSDRHSYFSAVMCKTEKKLKRGRVYKWQWKLIVRTKTKAVINKFKI